MKQLISFAKAKNIDQLSQKNYGIPDIVLMERAGLLLVEQILPLLKRESQICVLCGSGNNGGDGQVLARELHARHFPVSVAFIHEVRSDLAKRQLAMLRTSSVPIISRQRMEKKLQQLQHHDWIIDGITGVGLTRPLDEGGLLKIINQSRAKKLAIDVPSGLSEALNLLGEINPMVHADITVTFGLAKKAMYYPNVRDHCGNIIVCNPGFPSTLLSETEGDKVMLIDRDDIVHVPELPNHIYKHQKGVVAVAAGCSKTQGAALLTLHAATRSFAGMVYALLDEELRTAASASNPSVITGMALEEIQKIHALVLGPGWGANREETMQQLLNLGLTTVLDADALSYLPRIPQALFRKGSPRLVLTPHPGELRMLNPDYGHSGDLWLAARQVSQHYNAVVVAKNSVTAVVYKESMFIIDGRNPALANAGSGDVLSGMLGSYLARCVSAAAVHMAHAAHTRKHRALPLSAEALHLHSAIAVFLHAQLAKEQSPYLSSAETLLASMPTLNAMLDTRG